MAAMDLKPFIRSVQDFPKEGILFRDITPLLQNPAAFQHTIDRLAEEARERQAGAIVGIESRGFIFGCPVALALELPFVPVRKPGKLPAARMSEEYTLEYGSNQLDIHRDALEQGQSAFIVDDLLATGGTALATAKLVEAIGGKVAGFGFAIELSELRGRDRLREYHIASLVRY